MVWGYTSPRNWSRPIPGPHVFIESIHGKQLPWRRCPRLTLIMALKLNLLVGPSSHKNDLLSWSFLKTYTIVFLEAICRINNQSHHNPGELAWMPGSKLTSAGGSEIAGVQVNNPRENSELIHPLDQLIGLQWPRIQVVKEKIPVVPTTEPSSSLHITPKTNLSDCSQQAYCLKFGCYMRQWCMDEGQIKSKSGFVFTFETYQVFTPGCSIRLVEGHDSSQTLWQCDFESPSPTLNKLSKQLVSDRVEIQYIVLSWAWLQGIKVEIKVRSGWKGNNSSEYGHIKNQQEIENL